jgi:hypothetical protein
LNYSTQSTGYIYDIKFVKTANSIIPDTFFYVVRESNGLNLTDTGMAIIEYLPKSFELLDGNNISAFVDKNALFSNVYGHGNSFEVPAGSGRSTIFTSNLWVAGQRNDTTFGNVRRFGSQSPSTDPYFWSNSGPVSDFSHTQVLRSTKYDRVWKVKSYEIDYHLANWTNANYNPPPSFLEWPAHGDVTKGEAYFLAPFVDYDNDGTYNPYNGDYPAIKGDQAVYFMYNDGMTDVDIEPMKAEIHGMAYAFQCQDSALQNTVFVDYRIINRSNLTYDSTYFGMWTDLDIGNAQDDYVQCDVDRGLYFGYNGDVYDDGNSGLPGYGYYAPAQGVLTLKGAKQDNDGMDNAFGIGPNQSVNGTGFGDGIADNEYWGMSGFLYHNNDNSVKGDPRTGLEYHNYMKSKWKDSSPMMYGGTGHYASGGTTSTLAKFMFPDTSDTYNYGTGGLPMPSWTETTAGNVPFDRRAVSSSGPVTFAPGDEIELTYAFVFGMDYTTPGVQPGIDVMLERADSIRSYFNQGVLGACGFPLSTGSSIEKPKEIHIYPNPATDVITIQMNTTEASTIEIIDVTGKVVLIRNNQAQRATIDINNLPNGIYLVRVSSGSNMEVQKIVKQ